MKKFSLVIVIMLLVNFIFFNVAYAIPSDSSIENSAISFNISSMYQADQEGTVEIEGYTKEIGTTQSTVGAILGKIISPVVAVTDTASTLVAVSAVEGGYYRQDSDNSAAKTGTFSVGSIIFGEFLIFDAGITKTSTSLNPDITPSALAKIFDDVKEVCAGLFQIIRAVSMGLFIVLILVTVVRLSLSNVAEDRAKFKALMLDWVIGLIFSFFAKYVFLILNSISDLIMETLWSVRLGIESSGNFRSFEIQVYDDIWQVMTQSGGMQFFAFAILYILLAVVTIKFAIKYLLRVFKILFLVVISPVVGVIYTFQRAGDKGDNAIISWFKSYATQLFMQPIHAIVYLIFMFSASEIAINAPFLGIAFLWALERAEKIIKAIFGLNEKIDIVGKKE